MGKSLVSCFFLRHSVHLSPLIYNKHLKDASIPQMPQRLFKAVHQNQITNTHDTFNMYNITVMMKTEPQTML